MKGKFISISILSILLFWDFGLSVTHIQAAKQEILLMPWNQVNEILPRYSKFTVIDMDTGKKFQVQRRAGSRHADVQPLTKKDTIIMKEIYHGKWSWRRRSVIIQNGSKKIAASMHGMPHGAGALDNNFPGHFCIHFYGSTTHRTNNMDLSHKLMILKASNQLENYLASADPYEVIRSYVAGFKEHDNEITRLISMQTVHWKSAFGRIETVRISRMPIYPVEDLAHELYLSIPVNIEWYLKDSGPMKINSNVILIRASQMEPWKIDSQSFLENNEFPNKLKEKSLSN